MKHPIMSRFAPALLCLSLALSLAACGGNTKTSPADESGSVDDSLSTGDTSETKTLPAEENGSVDDPLSTGDTSETNTAPTEESSSAAETLSGGKGGKAGGASAASQEEQTPEEKDAIDLLRTCMAKTEQACAVAYLGYREAGDLSSLSDWIQDNCSGLAQEMPFLLSIPAERILGGSYGDLFCFVPRDENSSFAVNRIKWTSDRSSEQPENVKVLYRSEQAQPILVFSHCEEYLDKPDIEIHVIAENSADIKWYPQLDEWGNLVLPADREGNAAMLNFTVFGDTTGLDYTQDWADPAGDSWWLPPTDEGLADTTWVCDRWIMELRRGCGDPEYFGVAELFYQFEDGQEYQRLYTGVWRMSDDCLELMLSAGVGTSTGGCFPVLISPSGEELYIQESRKGLSPPFFDDDVTSMTMILSYG